MAKRLHNYLLTHRKRFGLTQAEVAFLLGCRHKTKVSDYEQHARRPVLETALAYELVFGTPVRELFAGIADEVEIITHRRARALARKLSAATQTPRIVRKLELLSQITSGSGSEPADDL
jgi:DNA-binding XRE family transcriptional regulator